MSNMVAKIKLFLYDLTSRGLLEESRKYGNSVEENIQKTQKLLTLHGKEEWMLNLCRYREGEEKECLPNEEDMK